ncbi:hypothetical protein GCM10025872_13060 [Barrientosiimonas endolithica]|uniref:Uncharacterized protein n=1 Tax=Barrientosiimonas endolithica TaxID=1535208 RepID=A0ABN6YJG4_9MICO|nr:hypothetical protein GCM10025872_13060 [Barrientosiimonas endolithica]
MADHRTITLRDGRTLAYYEFGDPDGVPAIYSPGTPASGETGLVYDDAARAGAYGWSVWTSRDTGTRTWTRGGACRAMPKTCASSPTHSGSSGSPTLGSPAVGRTRWCWRTRSATGSR